MIKNLSKKALAGLLSLPLASLLALPTIVGAVEFNDVNNFGVGKEQEFGKQVGLGKRDVKETVGNIINVVLGILGIIAVVIILAGGFKWMTAGGNEDKVGEARKMIIQGVIGLVVVFAAWGIASFVIDQISKSAAST